MISVNTVVMTLQDETLKSHLEQIYCLYIRYHEVVQFANDCAGILRLKQG